ncbi:MAG TPA: amino acid adenylation domain-containing protein [Candidatus Deferrimicrobium sp.]|nr:amino acid adenylation domain-containing protein [Candidatus Deferrimicrobium sp.]
MDITIKEFEDAKAYWLDKLTGELNQIDIPMDFPLVDRAAALPPYIITLGKKHTHDLLRIGKNNDLALFVILLTCLKTLFYKLTGQNQVIIASPVNDIEVREYNKFILFRDFIWGELTFKELLIWVKQTVVEGCKNQHYPMKKIIGLLDTAESLSLFKVTALLENIHPRAFVDEMNREFENDIVFSFNRPNEDELTCEIITNSKFLTEETVHRLWKYYALILDRVLNDTGTKIADIQLVSEAEQQHILEIFNKTGSFSVNSWTIQQLFMEQVSRTPDHIAVIGYGHHRRTRTNTDNIIHVGAGPRVCPVSLTYRQLNEQSDSLAGLLIEKGVLPDTIVAIMIERSLEMITGMLGILKAGGAYLPIDPEYPQERIDYMLKDSGAEILLTNKSEARSTKSETNPNDQKINASNKNKNRNFEIPLVLNFEDLNFEFVSCFDIRASNLFSSNLAYIIYTSGSTGKPKGVMINHPSIVNTLTWRKNFYRFNETDVCLQLPSFSFDSSVEDIFTPLISGSRLVLFPREKQLEIAYLGALVVRENVTHFLIVPSLYRAFLNEIPACLKRVKSITVAGEAIDGELVNEHFQKLAEVALYNEYGPTENSVCTTVYRFQPGDSRVFIGQPVANVTCYILDNDNRLSPPGVPGELYIGGIGLARGYLNNPELTNKSFSGVQGPAARGAYKELFQKHPLVFYKTGDLVRWYEDGNIEFLGRVDRQVKIRGYRVEIPEIEKRLMAHPAVTQAVVLAKEDLQKNKFLCAFIIPDNTRSVEMNELKNYLAEALPGYMVPGVMIALDKMPLTHNKKIDYKALSNMEINKSGESDLYESPRNDIEEHLVSIWQTVLGNDKIGIHDNFFDLGGDSIKAIQVVARLLKVDLKLNVTDLFLSPVIKELGPLVKRLDSASAGKNEDDSQGLVEGDVFLTPVQQWFFKNHLASEFHHHSNQTIMIYNKDGFAKEIIEKVFTAITHHHDALRMVYEYHRQEGEGMDPDVLVIQKNRTGDDRFFDLQVMDLRECLDPQVKIEAQAAKIQESINLNTGPLVKVGLFKTNTGDHLLIAIHHLVVDGVSWRILLEDFNHAYRQAANDEYIKLPSKTTSFKSWSRHLYEYAISETLLAELPYWQKTTKIQAISKDHEIGNEKQLLKYTETIPIELEDHLVIRMKNIQQSARLGIEDILLVTLALALNEWQGLECTAILMEGHGREYIMPGIDLSRTVGWFTSLYPFILEYRQDQDLNYTIRAIKQALRNIPAKGIGYGILKYITPADKKNGISLDIAPEISFNYLGEFGQEKDMDLVMLSPFKPGPHTSPHLRRLQALDFGGMMAGGKLKLSISYNIYEFDRSSMEKMAALFRENFSRLIDHCTHQNEQQLIPSEVGNTHLSIAELIKLQKRVTGKIGSGSEIQYIYSLTPMQAGMLYHSLKSVDPGMYFGQNVLTLHGEIYKEFLEMSYKAIIDRYDIFRTIFIYEGVQTPLQVVIKKRNPGMIYKDISHLSPIEQERYIAEFQKNDRVKGFDLSKDILLRIALLKTGENSCKLVESFHHITMDGWCIGIIFNDFIQVYRSLKEGKSPALPPAAPFRNYIQWLENRDKQEGLQYWQKYLADYRQPTGFPKTKQMTESAHHDSLEVKRYPFALDEPATGALNELAANNKVTLNSVFRTLWGILLQKYNNTSDVVFGAVVSGRSPEVQDIEHMVGLFINTVPVRIKRQDDELFCHLLQEVQHQAILANVYEYVPLAEIQAGSLLKGNLFDHIVVFENYPMQVKQESVSSLSGVNGVSDESTGFQVENMEAHYQTNYHLSIIINPGKKLSFIFGYNRLVYEDEFIKRLAAHFIYIITQVLKNSAVPVKDIEILTAEEKRLLLSGPMKPGETEYDF